MGFLLITISLIQRYSYQHLGTVADLAEDVAGAPQRMYPFLNAAQTKLLPGLILGYDLLGVKSLTVIANTQVNFSRFYV